MRRGVVLAVVTSVLLVGFVGPAGAKNDVYGLHALAKVSKTNVFGMPTGCTDGVPGPGLGVPFVHGVKKGYWRIDTTLPVPPGGPGFLVSAVNGPGGTLVACGRLGPVARAATGGIGAAVGVSKGYAGAGTITHPAKPGQAIGLSNLTWKTTAFPLFVVTGDATWVGATVKNGVAGDFVAVLAAMGAGGAPAKAPMAPGFAKHMGPDKVGGTTSFTVVGVAAVIQAKIVPAWNDLPAFCKEAGFPCAYGPKK